MGRPPCCDKTNVRRGLWTAEEDKKIVAYVSTHGAGNWASVPKKAGLKRCGKSCRLRWTNYLRPDLKHEDFTPAEEQTIISLHSKIGSRWSIIAHQLPGRTDNDVKNYWNTKLKKKLIQRGIDPVTHRPISHVVSSIQGLSRSSLPSSHTSLHVDHPPSSDLLSQIHAVNLVSQTLQAPDASSSSLGETLEVFGAGSSGFSWMDGCPASPAPQMTGGEKGGDAGDSSLADINSFVDSLLNSDDDMVWSFPEFLDDNFLGP